MTWSEMLWPYMIFHAANSFDLQVFLISSVSTVTLLLLFRFQYNYETPS